jgi:hypothetical protein
MTEDEMVRDWAERVVNPPSVIGPDTVVLCPPLGSVGEYMAYLEAHREDYRRLFGVGERWRR